MLVHTDFLNWIVIATLLLMVLISPFLYERDWEDEINRKTSPRKIMNISQLL